MGGTFTAPLGVLRLLTPLKMTYEAAKKRAAPMTRSWAATEMSAETVELVKQAVTRKIGAYVLVNNRPEGNAPLTIQALTDALNQPEHTPSGMLVLIQA